MTTHIRSRAAILILAVSGSMAIHAQTAPHTPSLAALSAAAVDREPPPIRLLVGRSTIVEAGTPISRVSVTSAKITDVLVTIWSQLVLHGKILGTTSLVVWDR